MWTWLTLLVACGWGSVFGAGQAAAENSGTVPREKTESVDSANLFLCTQAIGGPYRFTEEPYLLEVARRISAMGSNFIKFTTSFEGKPYGMKKEEGIVTLVDLLERHPVYREIMAMPFTYYHLWAYPGEDVKWEDGVDADEEKKLYGEFRGLTEHLLKKYHGTGKQFYLGLWEGDWTMSGAMDPQVDATPARIRGFIDYLRIRQRAVEDARREVPPAGVKVFHYVEVNMVIKKGLSDDRPTVTNSVLSEVNPDFVSYSCYDAIAPGDPQEQIPRALAEIESRLKPRPEISGKRVFAGEFAVKASAVDFDGPTHARKNLEIARLLIGWGCPFAVYWQFYCNEPNPQKRDGYEGFWLVDPKNRETELHGDFVSYYRQMKAWLREKNGSGTPPEGEEIRKKSLELLGDLAQAHPTKDSGK